MNEKTILITGSTDGIGKATALQVLNQGHQVIIHGRNEEKGRRVVRELAAATYREAPDLFIADFASQKAIRRLAAEITGSYPDLDVLINNAGTYQPERRLTENGVEMTLAVNYVAPFLLTYLLRGTLQKVASSRIVNVASSAHRDISTIAWDNLQGGRGYDPWNSYALSKFAVVTFTYRLAELLKGARVTVNCLHPGVINTKILRTAFPDMQGDTPDAGARTSIFLATSSEVEGVTGMYYEEMRQVRSEPLTYDPDVQKGLWKAAEGLTGITFE